MNIDNRIYIKLFWCSITSDSLSPFGKDTFGNKIFMEMLCPGSFLDCFWDTWESIVPKLSSGSQNLKKVFKNNYTSHNHVTKSVPLEKYDSFCNLGKRVQNWLWIARFDFFTISIQISWSLTKWRSQDTLGDSAWHYLLHHKEIIIGEGVQYCNSVVVISSILFCLGYRLPMAGL